jgi:hypothetical protein
MKRAVTRTRSPKIVFVLYPAAGTQEDVDFGGLLTLIPVRAGGRGGNYWRAVRQEEQCKRFDQPAGGEGASCIDEPGHY